MADLRNDPEWWPGTVKAELLTEAGGAHAGAVYRQTNQLLGLRFPTEIVITEYVAPERVAFKSLAGTPIPFACTYVLEDLDSRGTRVSIAAEVEARGGYFRRLGPLFQMYLRQLTRRNFRHLKAVLENASIS